MSDEEKEAIEWLKRLVKINKRDNLDDTFAEILLNLIEKQSKEIEELKKKNKVYSDVICRVRNLSSGVVSYDIINGKKYLGPRKNFSKQRLYEQFLNIELILKGNYIFLSNKEYLQQLLKEE